MKTIEERLKNYGRVSRIEPDEAKIKETAARARQSFYASVEKRGITNFEFIYEQTAYIRKRWWVLQFILLFSAGWYIHWVEDSFVVQRTMGVSAALFAILLIPELWKSRSNGSLEIEGASYFSLRQIYAAKMLAFAVVDSMFLFLFTTAVSVTGTVSIREIVIHFFLPMICTCCICFRALCSRLVTSEYTACLLSLSWTVVWSFVTLDEKIYSKLSGPVWIGICCMFVLYLTYAVRKVITGCEYVCESDGLSKW